MRLAVAIAVVIAAMALARADAYISPIICLNEREEAVDCPRDERPPAGGREARRALERVLREDVSDEKVIDNRNGSFVVYSRPSVFSDQCTVRVRHYGTLLIDHYLHARMSEAQCHHQVEIFERRDTSAPFENIGGVVLCNSNHGLYCLQAGMRLRQLAEQLDSDETLTLRPGGRHAEWSAALFRRLAANARPYIEILEQGQGCFRVAFEPIAAPNYYSASSIICDSREGTFIQVQSPSWE
jgi:hypothetical protein